jgi:hypothetical protein
MMHQVPNSYQGTGWIRSARQIEFISRFGLDLFLGVVLDGSVTTLSAPACSTALLAPVSVTTMIDSDFKFSSFPAAARSDGRTEAASGNDGLGCVRGVIALMNEQRRCQSSPKPITDMSSIKKSEMVKKDPFECQWLMRRQQRNLSSCACPLRGQNCKTRTLNAPEKQKMHLRASVHVYARYIINQT